MTKSSRHRLLLTGASGQLGSYILRELQLQQSEESPAAWGHSHSTGLFGLPLRSVDLSDPQDVRRAFDEAQPSVVIHAAAISNAELCVRDPELAQRVNVEGTRLLAELSSRAAARMVFVSTDCVFDGQRGRYREGDATDPLSEYGRTKVAAEDTVRVASNNVVVRMSLLYGPTLIGRSTFFDTQLAALRDAQTCRLFVDEWRTPLDFVTAARALLAVARCDDTGTFHLGGSERISRYEMGQRLARYLGCDPSVIVPARIADAITREPRPRDISLDCSRWQSRFSQCPLPAWEEAIRRVM